MASLPFISCLRIPVAPSTAIHRRGSPRRGLDQPVHRDRARFRAGHEADAAACTARCPIHLPCDSRSDSARSLIEITLGGQASMHSPQPLHSFTSIRNSPRSRFISLAIRFVPPLECGCPTLDSEICDFSTPFTATSHIHCLPLKIMCPHRKFFKLRLELRLGNRDQRFGAFAQRLSVQVSNTVLGHDVMHIGA